VIKLPFYNNHYPKVPLGYITKPMVIKLRYSIL
jgi:hypothetical protein